MTTTAAEIIIAGGGPAGVAAALMGHSLGIESLIVEPKAIGGRLPQIPTIANVPGFKNGAAYAAIMRSQVDQIEMEVVKASIDSVDIVSNRPVLHTAEGAKLRCDYLVWATGLRPQRPSEVGWVNYDTGLTFPDLRPGEVITTSDVDEMIVVGGDRPLGTFLRSSHEARLPNVHVLYRPDEGYKLDELRNGSWRITYHEVDWVTVSSGSGGQVTVEYGAIGQKIGRSLRSSVVRMNLGFAPNNAPLMDVAKLGENGYPTNCPPCIAVAGDAAHERFQRISVALGEGARAALDWYYQREKLI